MDRRNYTPTFPPSVKSRRLIHTPVRLFLLLFLFCLSLHVAFGQEEEERILSFHSDITIDTTGRIEVAEHITVYAAEKDIRHGIVRTLPLSRKDKNGRSVRVDYKVLSVKSQIPNAKFRTVKEDGNLAIYIGNADELLTAGAYKFVIVYETYGQIGLYDQYDELYWNVTGNGWNWSIEKASATIRLPDNADAVQTTFYTGKEGETGKNGKVSTNGRRLDFSTKHALAPHEGLTVTAGFTRDVINRKPVTQTADDDDGNNTQERIIRYHTDIKIDTTGRIEVAEHIKVYAAGQEIKRGLVRKLPLSRKDKNDKSVRVKYNLLSVQCNGVNSKYHTEYENGNFEIYVGEADVLLTAGMYEYTFVYEVYGQVGFHNEYDELYWNITGNEWIFAIEQASAAITLPDGAAYIQSACYTGVQGATEKACTCNNDGAISTFAATRKLSSGEGLTVAVGFTRDIIDRNKAAEALAPRRANKNAPRNAILLSVICIGYFLITRLKAGKAPRKGVAIPTFRPPRDMSPASVFYLKQHSCNNDAFSATLIDMAVKGALTIRQDEKKKYTLINRHDTSRLYPEEQTLHAALFAESDTMALDGIYDYKLKTACDNFKKAIPKQWNLRDFYLRTPGRLAMWGGVLLNVAFLLYQIITGVYGGVAEAFAIASLLVMLALGMAFNVIPTSGCAGGCLSTVAGLMITFVWVITVFLCTDSEEPHVHWFSFFFFAAMSLIYIIYAFSMKMRSPEGVKMTAELDGFKMYMKTAEEHRLNMLNPPEKTPELFERLLPYAIALGVSNEWCKRFAVVIAQSNYEPQWYSSDSRFSGVELATAFTVLGSSLSASVRSTSTDTSSSSSSSGSSDWSSGSDGGGSSGGGGGGGGGGGW